MNSLVAWMEVGFQFMMYAAVAAAPLALAAWAVDAALGRTLPARYRCWLWTLVALRFLAPWAPPTPLSWQNAAGLFARQEPQDLVNAPDAATPAGAIAALPVSAADVAPRFNRLHDTTPTVKFANLLQAAWIAGFALIACRSAIASVRFSRCLHRLPAAHETGLLAAVDDVCRQLGVRRRPVVKHVPDLASPALFGVLRPTLCLPAQSFPPLSDSQLRMVLLHEVTHLRRRDAAWAWMLTAVNACQWFNPFAWLTTGRVALYREQACDEAVRQFTNPCQRRGYADLLIRFAASRPTQSLGLVGLWFARPMDRLSARLGAFLSPVETRRGAPRATFAAIIVALVLIGFTDAASEPANAGSATSVAEFMTANSPVPHAHLPFQSVDDDPHAAVEVRTYDIAPALNKLREIDPGADARAWLLSYLALPSWRPQSIESSTDEPHRLELAMTPRQHEDFAGFLAAVGRTGPWQVVVECRRLRAPNIEALGNIDWQDAVKFALPANRTSSQWPEPSGAESPSTDGLSLTSESVSWQYAPYLATVIDKRNAKQILDRFQNDPRSSIVNSPKVTVFNGQHAMMRDQCKRPFVVGVHYVKGELATAAQPDVAMISEGASLDVVPRVIDADAVDLQCRLTVSRIDAVGQTKLPGQEVTVQTPRASRQTISARCRLAPGETLLIAPLNEDAVHPEATCYAVSAHWFPDTSPLPAAE